MKKITPIIKELRNLNIVIVEDNMENRRTIEKLLDKYGFHKRSFYTNPKDALDAIQTGSLYDLVILNWKMQTECKSISFCKSIAKLKKSMPLIFITSESHEDYYKAFEAGATNIIRQPFNEKDFLEAVWSAIDIEAFRRGVREKDFFSLRKKTFFRLQQIALQN